MTVHIGWAGSCENGFSPVPHASMTARTSTFQDRQLALPSILKRHFCGELTIHQFESLLNARQAEDDKELDAAATECRRMKRAKQTLARLPHPAASSTTTSAPLVPAPLGHTPPPSPRTPDTGRSRTPPPERPRPIDMHPGPPLTEPSSSTAAPPRGLLAQAVLVQVSGSGIPQTWLVHERH